MFSKKNPTNLILFLPEKKDGIIPNSFYEADIILILRPEKDSTTKENYRQLMNINAKIF